VKTNDTVSQLVRQVERQHGGRVAVEDLDGNTLSVAGLRDRSNRLATALLELGLEPGDRVAYASRNRREYFEIDFALAKAGLVKVPLYFRLAADELARSLEAAAVSLVLADDEVAGRLDELDLPGVRRVSFEQRDGWLGYEELVCRGRSADPGISVGPDETYHIRFSSGSTGPPKGIPISHRGARAAMLGNLWIMSTQGWADSPRTLQQAPLVFAGGWSVLPTLLMGGTNVVVPDFDPDLMLRSIVERRIQWLFAVPTMLRRLAEVDGIADLRDTDLRCLMYAGEPAPLEALAVLTEHTDALVQCWGQTEAPASTTYLSRREHADRSLWPSVGRPIPGVEFAILRDGAVPAETVPDDVGEIAVRGPAIATTLIGAEEEYHERLLDGGWWRTGDTGRFDGAGRLFIEGRLSEVIISGGTNIHPTEIENALEEHPAVAEAVVVGVPDRRWGETPAAYMSAPGWGAAHADGFDEWMANSMSRFKRPRHVFVTSAPLPRASAEAKPARGDVRRLVEAWLAGGSLPEGTARVAGPTE
jgi:fatty-acyl-CoA synthase